jgi:hypothetical protein
MKTFIKLSSIFCLIFFIFSSCEITETTQLNQDLVSPTIKELQETKENGNNLNPFYNWKMVVNTVEKFKGEPHDEAFINVLLGNRLSNGIETTNTTYFNLRKNTNKLDLYLQNYGWTLWEAYGFYPIKWDFSFTQKGNTFELEGLANIGLGNCQQAIDGILLSNRFHFKGTLQTCSNQQLLRFNGTYKWEETYKSGICISIEGNMDVIKIYDMPS